eukprot:4737638-Pleurochrysis_carterae.AAC.2
MIDNHPEHGGGDKHGLLLDSVYARPPQGTSPQWWHRHHARRSRSADSSPPKTCLTVGPRQCALDRTSWGKLTCRPHTVVSSSKQTCWSNARLRSCKLHATRAPNSS